jgi:hypothetical protein
MKGKTMPGMPQRPNNVNLEAIRKIFGSSLILFALAMLLLIIAGLNFIKFGRVSGEEVGILLDKTNGKIEVINQSGVKIYNGVTKKFYALDKTIQTMEMTERTGRGDRSGKDDLKIKTQDGSDVYVDLKVQYRIMPEMAEKIILTSGPGNNFKRKWARDYVRSIVRNCLGELTTEEFYDASKRKVKLQKAKKTINDRLVNYGLTLTDIVIPQKPHFYREYEEMIKKKKLADQAVLEEKSKALAAQQKQLTLIQIQTNEKNVAVEQFKGTMEQKIIRFQAEGEKVRKSADAYFDQVTIGAQASLYEQKQNANGILAQKKAEAKGIEALKKALEGEGGRNMVKMEYAKKLKDISISGKPFTIQSHVEKFEHNKAPASNVIR